jgi:hypothetical protein
VRWRLRYEEVYFYFFAKLGYRGQYTLCASCYLRVGNSLEASCNSQYRLAACYLVMGLVFYSLLHHQDSHFKRVHCGSL